MSNAEALNLQTGWFADWDEEAKGWQPCIQTPALINSSLEIWFPSEEACLDFIRTEVLGQGEYGLQRTGYTYIVQSNVPLTVFSGIGNTAIVSPTSFNPITTVGETRTASSGPQASPATLHLTLQSKGDTRHGN